VEISEKVSSIKIGAYINSVKDKKNVQGSPEHDDKTVANGDKVELSQMAMDVKKARDQLETIPDIRAEKVAEIKNEIDNGTYKIDGKKIAFKMLKESLIDEIV